MDFANFQQNEKNEPFLTFFVNWGSGHTSRLHELLNVFSIDFLNMRQRIKLAVIFGFLCFPLVSFVIIRVLKLKGKFMTHEIDDKITFVPSATPSKAPISHVRSEVPSRHPSSGKPSTHTWSETYSPSSSPIVTRVQTQTSMPSISLSEWQGP